MTKDLNPNFYEKENYKNEPNKIFNEDLKKSIPIFLFL